MSEDWLQNICEKYLSLKNIKYIHLPKGTQRFVWNKKFGIPIQVAMEASKALKGVPDLILFGLDGTYQLIELKSKKGKLTEGQKEWLGYGLKLFREFDEFQKFVDEWDLLHNPRC
ncbi:MAG: VRR-NUC domain-containing protein [Fibromonadales bacterium]|nr:VRR-NUC domain-containing protein [Fibromonadales bacterium]